MTRKSSPLSHPLPQPIGNRARVEMADSPGSAPFALDVLVVGGGLSGLATAIAVVLAGHRASVFEAAAGIFPFGAGMPSPPNGARLLARWGLGDLLRPAATAPTSLRVHGVDGRLLAQQAGFDADVARRCGAPWWAFHRVDLQGALARRAVALGAAVRFSSRVTGLDTAAPAIQLENGERHAGDLVVLADGAGSALRSQLLGGAIYPQPTGCVAYRITVERNRARSEELRELMNQLELRFWLGPDSYAIGYPVRGGTQYSVLLLLPDSTQYGLSGNASTNELVEELRERLRGWDPS